jgi:hypothetical protein
MNRVAMERPTKRLMTKIRGGATTGMMTAAFARIAAEHGDGTTETVFGILRSTQEPRRRDG